jgi:hypothetical protein
MYSFQTTSSLRLSFVYYTCMQPTTYSTYVVIRPCRCLVEWASKPSLWLHSWAITSSGRDVTPLVPTLGSTVACNSKRVAALVPVRSFVHARQWKRQSYVAETSPSLKFLAAKWFRFQTLMLGIAIDARRDQEPTCDGVLCCVRVGNCRQLPIGHRMIITEMMHWVFVT